MDKRKVVVRKLDGEIIKGYVDPTPEPVSAKDDKIVVKEEIMPKVDAM